ncbi:hypothetical protein F2Q69_00055621 [Brassica cretica]|uniref:BIRD-IDD transcription factor fourth C2HC zinc finger domain-containing protein n=1 Tax=Brassica cretica TaxID=69181 RepID=A0A8S9MR53_BRACR|nr:hypothetical protein F2Q69_00055621 [Brassica cretica]
MIGDDAEAMHRRRRMRCAEDDVGDAQTTTEAMRRRRRRRCADDDGGDAQTTMEVMRRRYADNDEDDIYQYSGTTSSPKTYEKRDSYITHRAFCDALIQETVRNPTVSFTSMAAASSGAGLRGFHGKLEGGNALSHQHLSDHPNSGFSSFGGYNLNIASSENSREFAPQTSNPNFLIQCSSSQGMLPAPNNNNNDQSFMNQQGLIQFDPVNNINLKSSTTNNSFFNLGFFQENTKNSETAIPSLYSTDSLVHHREESLNAGSNVSATALLKKNYDHGRWLNFIKIWSRLRSRRWAHEEKMQYLEDFPQNSEAEQSDQGTVQVTVLDLYGNIQFISESCPSRLTSSLT